MPAYGDDELWMTASNIQVQVGTPPPLPPDQLPSNQIPAKIFTLLDIESRRTEEIGADRTKDLIGRIKNSKPPAKFLIKNYGDSSAVVPPSLLPPPPASPPTPSPPSLPPSTKSHIPDLPPGIPFDEIKYIPKDLLGVLPGKDPKTGKSKSVDPLMKSMYESFKDFPSAIYVDDISSCINTPYFSPEGKRHRNGVLGDQRTADYADVTYFWEMENQTERGNILTPRADGVIDVKAQPRSAKKPRGLISMDAGKWEQRNRTGIKNGDSLNAFALIMGIQPGEGNSPQAAAYTIGISFGEVKFWIYENQESARITIQGKNPQQKVNIQPTIGSVLTSGFGSKVYILSFIPVWNGLLISSGIPGSSDWINNIRFIPVDKDLDVVKEINAIVTPPPKNDYDIPDPTYVPKTVIKRNGNRYKQYGVRVVNSKTNTGSLSRSNTGKGIPHRLDMGKKLHVMYYHCGGALKFVPLYFAQYSRYHFIYPGSASSQDLEGHKEYVRNQKTGDLELKPLNQNVFYVTTKSDVITMPVFAFQSGSFVDFRTHVCTIVRDKQGPFACFSMEFKNYTPDVRVPIQVWGGLFADNAEAAGAGSGLTPLPNQDGVLSGDAISIPRIRSVSVQRALDGSSGTLEWDRFDPLTQTVDPRPYQQVGGIRIQVTGGKNTVPGVIFTGIAYGNSEEDQPGENLIRVPLKGRESKLSEEGGLSLIRVPFFDGWDHREAMRYMAIYGGFPINWLPTDVNGNLLFGRPPLADPFPLPSSYNINSPIVDFPMGTAVAKAMDSISNYGGANWYFDRFGTCVYIDLANTTGRNWEYSDLFLESFSDEPDHTWVRNMIFVTGLVAYPQASKTSNTSFVDVPVQAVVAVVNLETYPTFDWGRTAVFPIPQILRDMDEFRRIVTQVSKGQSRPRSQARCRVPGNSQIELLDTVNTKWLVTSISHQVDLQRKTWSTELGVEQFAPDVEPVAHVDMPPLIDLE